MSNFALNGPVRPGTRGQIVDHGGLGTLASAHSLTRGTATLADPFAGGTAVAEVPPVDTAVVEVPRLEAPAVGAARPRLRGNRWSVLTPPALGRWTMTQTVSVVIPAYNAHDTLPYTLAALAAQTYPAHLMEVIVVDDGSERPLELPALRPANTRIVSDPTSWGRAHACRTGAAQADGDVVFWLDADMLPFREHVEAQMRWHSLCDYAVVLGQKSFVDPAEGMPCVADAAAAVRAGRPDLLFAGERWRAPHEWIEQKYRSTEQLNNVPFRAYRAHVGATASVRRELYASTGGMDASLKLGEDIELGYRLAQRGAVFLPDLESRAWHLGVPAVVQRHAEVNAFNRPYLANRVSDFRSFRSKGRSYLVPHVEVVVHADDASFDDVAHTITSVLSARPQDQRVLVVGDWASLGHDRGSLRNPRRREAAGLVAEFAGEPRVRFVDDLPATSYPAMFRLVVPAGWGPGRHTVHEMLTTANEAEAGLVLADLADGRQVRLERTASFERALRLCGEEDVDTVVAQVSAVTTLEAPVNPFLRPGEPEAPAPHARARRWPRQLWTRAR